MAAAAVTHTIQTLLLLLFISRLREGKYQNGTSLFAPIHCGTTRLSFFAQKKKNRATRVQHKVYVANHYHPKSVLFKNHFLILISKKRTTFADVFVFEFSRRRLLCCVGLRAAATSSSILLLISKLKPISHIQKEKRRPLFRPHTHAEETRTYFVQWPAAEISKKIKRTG